MATIVAVCSSEEKGMPKKNAGSGMLKADFGLVGDAHGGPWHRQVSLLAIESIQKMRGLGLDVHPGDFAENITTEGIDLLALPIGARLKLGPEAVGEVTQIGKECHSRCAIYYQAGDCVMPKEGIFIRVLTGGPVQVGDAIEVIATGEAAPDKMASGEAEDGTSPQETAQEAITPEEPKGGAKAAGQEVAL
ncbi:mosc domain protein [Heliomicrobium modesticaldum Ice1]|uniref:Mosc domain protein n=1 Tax=Heliobacterium modesticaldum (strain ATCC 51547 / Ice1) TaxID=498761 RepID=B0TI14_HELMI|nr:mosc domain protein [Heliomicrobium modesticaldum Ice1]